MYAIGEVADEIVASLQLNESTISYDNLIKELNDYFGVGTNLIGERAKFNRRVQRHGESMDSFIASLYDLSSQCEFKELRNDLIRDRLVVGVLDDELSHRLQTNAVLTLQDAIKSCRQLSLGSLIGP